MSASARLICVMGVAGSGKSSIGAALAGAVGAVFIEADAYHPPANVEKMTAGVPLTDEDRWPWLDALGAAAPRTGRVVIACSALRLVYRQRLARAAGEPVFFVHLAGARDVIAGRMAARSGHFMPTALLESQFATLEPPAPPEPHLTLDISDPPERLIAIALEKIA
ncbi:MAG: gluconokinase [Pikeienuella sp.]